MAVLLYVRQCGHLQLDGGAAPAPWRHLQRLPSSPGLR